MGINVNDDLPQQKNSKRFSIAVVDPATGTFKLLRATNISGDYADINIATTNAGGTPTAGSKTDVGTTAAALTAGQSCFEVIVQADPDNTVDVFFGTSGSQPMQLLPGQAVRLKVSNVNLVYVKTASGTATVNWLSVV